jgi:hypothetical protein
MNGKNTPTYDPADAIIAHALKDWVRHTELPGWVRAQMLLDAPQSPVKVSTKFVMHMIFRWVLLRGFELSSFLFNEDQLVLLPSRDNYYFNPPHFKPCAVQARVRDTFLLEAGLLVAV